MTGFDERVERNRAAMRTARFRWMLLALIPIWYVITVIVRVIAGVPLPRALWDLGTHGPALLTWSMLTILVVLAHWRWTSRR